MRSVTIPVKANDHPHIRPVNVLRDLSAVADLIELCFSSTMDHDGQRYLSDMRRASRDDSFMNWASHMAETASMPMTGYVWEQDGRIVGNASLIPFRDHGKRVYLIANVATHPEYRRHGIGRALTERTMLQARAKNASAVWLHVREDNPGAIRIYAEFGVSGNCQTDCLVFWSRALPHRIRYGNRHCATSSPFLAPPNQLASPQLPGSFILVPLLESQCHAAGFLEFALSLFYRFST